MMRSAGKRIGVACVVVLLGAAGTAGGAEKERAAGVGFVPLFDGKDA